MITSKSKKFKAQKSSSDSGYNTNEDLSDESKGEEDEKDKQLLNQESYEKCSAYVYYLTYLSYYVLTIFGWLRDLLRASGLERKRGAKDPNPLDFPPLYSHYENFYKKNIFIRGQDIMNRPICSVPAARIQIAERQTHDYNWSFQLTGRHLNALNLGSYNYLGFAENDGNCSRETIESIRRYGVASCSSRQELGNNRLQDELENLMRTFLGVEDCITFGMGFATNALNIPALVDKDCLIFSDSLNHTSIVLGCRLSGAKIVSFKHNDCKDLEIKLRENIIDGQKNSKRLNTDWKKIFIIIEGVYSMEGSIAPLRDFIALKKKYKAYLYLDEAHSIGAIGPSGRGVVDYWGCDPSDVDILMGTFTKSFGSAGGYIAGSKDLINHIRLNSHSQCYASSMSPPVVQQIISSIRVIMGLDGTNDGRMRIERLRENSHFFREKLKRMGFIVYGNNDSPIVPLMVFMPAKLVAFNREMLKRNIAVVSVGYPAVGLCETRIRICLSASHTREMLDEALKAIDEVGQLLSIKYSNEKYH